MIRVLIVENMQLVRQGLVALLSNEPDMTVVAAVGADDDVIAIAAECKPDVALIDVDMPDVDGFATARTLHETVPACATMITAGRRRPGDLRRAVAARVVGFVLKDSAPEALAGAIRRVAKGERVIDAELAFTTLGLAESPLTPRELDVLRLAAEGASAGQIADSLVLTIGTVRNHLSRINNKIGARNRVHAIRIAEEGGWL